jgi:hypothetical protein
VPYPKKGKKGARVNYRFNWIFTLALFPHHQRDSMRDNPAPE